MFKRGRLQGAQESTTRGKRKKIRRRWKMGAPLTHAQGCCFSFYLGPSDRELPSRRGLSPLRFTIY